MQDFRGRAAPGHCKHEMAAADHSGDGAKMMMTTHDTERSDRPYDILVAEDSPTQAHYLARLLAAEPDCRVRVAADGPSAYVPADRFILMRVPVGSITSQSAYQFFSGTPSAPRWVSFAASDSAFARSSERSTIEGNPRTNWPAS